jgi:hypothetical protein
MTAKELAQYHRYLTVLDGPVPARDPQGTLPQAAGATQRSERLVDERHVCGGAERCPGGQWCWGNLEWWRGRNKKGEGEAMDIQVSILDTVSPVEGQAGPLVRASCRRSGEEWAELAQSDDASTLASVQRVLAAALEKGRCDVGSDVPGGGAA